MKPARAPTARQTTVPTSRTAGEPAIRWLATQLTSVITAPTDRSRPPASTGTVWAMATMIRAKLSLLFWISTAALKPFGCRVL